jgi:hypothetical protein
MCYLRYRHGAVSRVTPEPKENGCSSTTSCHLSNVSIITQPSLVIAKFDVLPRQDILYNSSHDRERNILGLATRL